MSEKSIFASAGTIGRTNRGGVVYVGKVSDIDINVSIVGNTGNIKLERVSALVNVKIGARKVGGSIKEAILPSLKLIMGIVGTIVP